jgi:hypothetical protein
MLTDYIMHYETLDSEPKPKLRGNVSVKQYGIQKVVYVRVPKA